MSFEIHLLNTYDVCGQERTETLCQVATAKDARGAEAPPCGTVVDVNIAVDVAGLMQKRQSYAASVMEVAQAA